MMSELRAEAASSTPDGGPQFRDIDFVARPGEFVAILGPNGAGKTTFLQALAGLRPLTSGQITVSKRPLDSFDAIERARTISYLPQSRPISWPLTVQDIVGLGRYAFGGSIGRPSERCRAAIEHALEQVGMQSFRDRRADTLSGGELARVHLARALAAEAPILLADEPILSLDPAQQFRILEALKRVAMSRRAVVAVLHDIQLAARFASHVVILRDGRLLASGTPDETLTPQVIGRAFDLVASGTGRELIIEGPAETFSARSGDGRA
ncbi:ABC transporter ATP-binding protein [Parvularcula sp. LCG005]|uniref:ABC transporter ATP-binding protein n=1 Tax=Parvularcula sp. LCG005 TaxID=3078805 RepID=UPI002942E347|nr:ABC transporter ATP-binding protein [Parvularcula sp. LCG005]WOI52963.1 ABC transporter ATP-binding protein [Parvularcula sp. LCG005]